MSRQDQQDAARIQREAKDAAVHRGGGGDQLAVQGAIKRYLVAEQYADEHVRRDPDADGEDPGEPSEGSGSH
jgi:hypothetical protein